MKKCSKAGCEMPAKGFYCTSHATEATRKAREKVKNTPYEDKVSKRQRHHDKIDFPSDLDTRGLLWRRCTKCQRVAPFLMFPRDESSSTGHTPHCLTCVNGGREFIPALTSTLPLSEAIRLRSDRIKFIYKLPFDSKLFKICAGCDEPVELQDFGKHSGRLDNTADYCKQCSRVHGHGDIFTRFKIDANRKLNNALATKNSPLTRPSCCEECGEVGSVEGHHCDYSKPLEVNWLCTRCHAKWHERFKFHVVIWRTVDKMVPPKNAVTEYTFTLVENKHDVHICYVLDTSLK